MKHRVPAAVSPLIILCAAVTIVPSDTAQDQPLLIRIDGQRVVMVFDPATRSERTLYETTLQGVTTASVSPSSDYVAFLEVAPGRVAGGAYVDPPRSELVVLTGRGDEVARLSDVHRYSWCCGQHGVAYVTGEYYEGGVGFRPGSTHWIDLRTRASEELPGPPAPVEIGWAHFDSAIYVRNLSPVNGVRVFRYRRSLRTLEETPYRAMDFSPDGRFYLSHPTDGDPVLRLFETATNREVALPDTQHYGIPLEWLGTAGSHLLLVRVRVEYQEPPRDRFVRLASSTETVAEAIYDAGQRRVVRRLDAAVSSWKTSRGTVVLQRGSGIAVVTGPRL